MPADDLVLNVRQIAGYGAVSSAPPNASLLMQLNGLGSPYASISPAALVGTALAAGGDMTILGALSTVALQFGSGQFSNLAGNLFSATKACVDNAALGFGSIAGVPIATVADLTALDAALRASTVWTFNGRRGDVRLWIDDIRCAGGAPIASPMFLGSPRAGTPPPTSNSSRLATTAFVVNALAGLTLDFAPLDSPAFSGVPSAPTAPAGTSDGQLATTAFVMNAVEESTTGVASFNTRTGVVALTLADIIAAAGAPIAGPLFTGVPEAPTAAPGTTTTQLATCAFVQTAITAQAAPIASPAFTGIPTGPTANPGTNTAQLATTAFVAAAVLGSVATFNGRSGNVLLIANDISGAGGAILASPAFTGAPTAPTAAPGTTTTQLATCAFVAAAIAAIGSGVVSFNGRSGAITLTTADVTGAGGAPLASPAFTGIPVGPTAALNTNTTQLATTAYVMAAITAISAGVVSFNGRSGAVTLTAADVSAAGGPYVPFSGGTMTGALALVGVVTGTGPAAGQVGEYQSAVFAAQALTTSVNLPLGSLTLTPGDWDVWGNVQLVGSTQNLTNTYGWISTNGSPAFNPATGSLGYSTLTIGPSSTAAVQAAGFALSPVRINVTASTPVYLTASASFPNGTATGQGTIAARRVR